VQPIVGWMHGDEPDNAQARRRDGYAPPIAPHQVVAGYEAMKKADQQRPVLLNLGQGAAWDAWHGRGERTNHPEDYAEYCKGCDVVSFDIYPVTHDHRLGAGAARVRRARRAAVACSGPRQKPVWACIETGHVSNAEVRPTPQQVADEVWMAIACGASGIVYFSHEFAPKFVEAGLLTHDDVRPAVAALNAELTALAPVLNSPMLDDVALVRGEAVPRGEEHFAVRAHQDGATLHLLVASLSREQHPLVLQLQKLRVGTASWRDADGKEQQQRLQDGELRTTVRGYGHLHLRVVR
jgi:hypothetical protein